MSVSNIAKRPTASSAKSAASPSSAISSPHTSSALEASRTQFASEESENGSNENIPSRFSKEHLLLIDSDDQIVYSGPSTVMPLFARLGLLHTVEVSESDKEVSHFTSHSAEALGITRAATSSDNYIDLCLQACPKGLVNRLISQHMNNPVFFPLLHTPSFLSEFNATIERRLPCTAQYGAMLMAILAVTVRFVGSARALLPPQETCQAGEAYSELSQNLLRLSKNKLDIRYILALYHLALFSEGHTSPGSASIFVAEAVSLAFATGLHRSTVEFRMDPVTLQIRTRLFWALYMLDITLSYSQGRPPLIKLSECNVDLPIVISNEYIRKTEILPQPDDSPPLAIAAAVKTLQIYIVLEQVLSAINAPSKSPAAAYSLSDAPTNRSELMRRAQMRLDEIERQLPSYLSQTDITPSPTSSFLFSCRVRTVFQFVRTLIARQALMDELEDGGDPAQTESASSATLEACRLSVDTVKTYSRLRHLGLLRFCGFQAVSHITTAAHTLIACMLKDSNLTLEHRPDLLLAIDILSIFAPLIPHAETVAQSLLHLSRDLDRNNSSTPHAEAAEIRVLARRMARSSPKGAAIDPSRQQGGLAQRLDAESLSGSVAASQDSAASFDHQQPPGLGGNPLFMYQGGETGIVWPSSAHSEMIDPAWMYGVSDNTVWEDSFSFLNDGLFRKI
ncbi:Fungal trans [Geosmithia morbida]|uniref:Fungal trans n=1 Tax=Geosmithia morbida TaxID=1094350 RepID=A0A9P4Z1R5_9HYPO|nr:Fungal trans [Geosmithia morbida]KAF4126552.1 Fungal trans [Geosmithia morbida]